MNNTAIDIAARFKMASKLAKKMGGNEITINCDELIKLCEATKKLAEYKDMEPMAHFIIGGDGFIGEALHEYKNDSDVFPLYRHPSKESLKFTAEIELTDFVNGSNGKAIAYGKIFNDIKKRFSDGTEIKTSLITNPETYKTDGYIKTQNSIYKIRE
ncbi:hypothetical protein Xmau_00308 [Xenorhabdus mauleonii]|uniref:Uncharacterized protein n=1 Tax=Xenorhabdus mauleonii TaxID=351675 RepID=A0A1I3U5R2_9GAMM|nr:hypothetical protein [Xenorhabdus mauleonii]PHM45917.1 hypothetical protein Xmau_00308 [Xenorhabdus mauleonii]SFJ78360.1 hypothetical protein SAMN05421680_11623 [Xenorhabdus mauleonii]